MSSRTTGSRRSTSPTSSARPTRSTGSPATTRSEVAAVAPPGHQRRRKMMTQDGSGSAPRRRNRGPATTLTAAAAAFIIAATPILADQPGPAQPVVPAQITRDDIRSVAPALDQYTQDHVLHELWQRPGLTARERSIVTVSALIARNQTIEMPFYFGLALDNGVKPRELS